MSNGATADSIWQAVKDKVFQTAVSVVRRLHGGITVNPDLSVTVTGGGGGVASVSGSLPIAIAGTPTVPIVKVNVATNVSLGVVQPDGTSITVSAGVISATGGAGPTFITGENVFFSGTTGTLAGTPISGSLMLYRNGVRQNPGISNDYTISGSTVTLSIAASGSDVFLADYRT